MIPTTLLSFLKISCPSCIAFHINFRTSSSLNRTAFFQQAQNWYNRTQEWQFLSLYQRSCMELGAAARGQRWGLFTHMPKALPPSRLLCHTWSWTQSVKEQWASEHILSSLTSSELSHLDFGDPLTGNRQRDQELASGPCSSQVAPSKGVSLEALAMGETNQGCLEDPPAFCSQHLEVYAPLGGFTSTWRQPLEEAKNY